MIAPHISQADYYSCYPILQQGVGVATVVSNVLKLAKDLAERILHCAFDALNYLRNRSGESLSEKSWSYEKNTIDMKEHAKYIGVGIFRMIPIVGTMISRRRMNKQQRSSEKQVEIKGSTEESRESTAVLKELQETKKERIAELQETKKERIAELQKGISNLYKKFDQNQESSSDSPQQQVSVKSRSKKGKRVSKKQAKLLSKLNKLEEEKRSLEQSIEERTTV